MRCADGDAWSVRRRWLPHSEGRGVRARFKRRRARRAPQPPETPEKRRWYDWLDPVGGCLEPEGLWILVGLIVLVVLVVFGPAVVLLGVDLAWFVVAFVAGVIGRVVLGRPWRVEALNSVSGERRNWAVRGFRGAGQLRDSLRAEFDAGWDPRPDVTTC